LTDGKNNRRQSLRIKETDHLHRVVSGGKKVSTQVVWGMRTIRIKKQKDFDERFLLAQKPPRSRF
jgi:hypothetical protein